MTIKELKEKLNEFDNDLEIGGSGHYGECLELYDVYLSGSQSDYKYVILEIEYIGTEPD